MINTTNKSIILFDGICNICNSSIQFIIQRDIKEHFMYTSLQSDAAARLLLQFNLKNSDFDSVLLVENDKVYQKSTAVLKILKTLGGFWKLFYLFIIIPKSIRDFVYVKIAENRYRWFGKRNECMIPTEELKRRFL